MLTQLDELELSPPSADSELELLDDGRNDSHTPQVPRDESQDEEQGEEQDEEESALLKPPGTTDDSQESSAPGAVTDPGVVRQSALNADRERQKPPLAAATTPSLEDQRAPRLPSDPFAGQNFRTAGGSDTSDETEPKQIGRFAHSFNKEMLGGSGGSPTNTRGSDGSEDRSGTAVQPSSTTGNSDILRRQATGTKRPIERTKSGRLLSYTEPAMGNSRTQDDADESSPEVQKRRTEIEKAAVDHFLATARGMWREVTVIPNPTNPGFDIQAIAHDGIVEFIEVKGQSGAWTETGVAVSPTQLRKAQEERERFWLCVVEYATDESRRQLYLIKNPFGLTDQFRFDRGWKGVATVVAARPVHPKEGLFVNIDGEGKARIIGVKGSGLLARIDYQFLGNGQKRFNKIFKPNTMTLGVD